MTTLNFKKFINEDFTSGPSFLSQPGRQDFIGNSQELPDDIMEFPTTTKTAPVLSCKIVGKNYQIQLQGESTIYVECNKFHKLFGKRLPNPGDIITAVFYKFKENNDKNYKLKKIYLNRAS